MMKSRFLLPAYYKILGWLLTIPGFILGYLVMYHNFEISSLAFKLREQDGLFSRSIENYTNELAIALVIIGLLCVVFSKEKHEDELINRLRMDSLYWAVLINVLGYMLIAILMWLFNIGLSDEGNLNVYNLFTPLLIFIIRFNYLLRFRKESYIIPVLKFLPNYPYRRLGKTVSLICIFAFALEFFLDYQTNVKEIVPNWVENLHLIFLLGSLLLWAYSKRKREDELTMQYRMESIFLAVLFNYGLLLIANFTVYSFGFLIILFINAFSLLLFFVARFGYVSTRPESSNESYMKRGLLV